MKEKGVPVRLFRVVDEILHYFVENHEAKDNVEGIFHWWFQREAVETTAQEVQDALDLLVSKEWVIARGKDPYGRIYMLNKTHLKEIKQFFGNE